MHSRVSYRKIKGSSPPRIEYFCFIRIIWNIFKII